MDVEAAREAPDHAAYRPLLAGADVGPGPRGVVMRPLGLVGEGGWSPRRALTVCMLFAAAVAAILSACQREERYEGQPLEFWVAALRNADPRVREQAVEVVARAAPRSPRTVDMLLDVLEAESDTNLYVVIAETLGELGPVAEPAVQRLAQLLTDDHREVREAAATALGMIGPPAAPAAPVLAAALRDCCHDVRAAAAEALGRIGPGAISAGPSLIECQGDGISWVRLKCVESLVAIGAKSPEAVGAFTRALDDPREAVRATAASGLARAGPGASTSVAALARRLGSDPYPGVRLAAAKALAAIGPAARGALPELERAQSDSNFSVRAAVRDAMIRIGGA